MRLAAILLATGFGLAACATELTPTAIDTRSPAAARVAREAGAPARMPTFGDIPPRPEIRTVAAYDTEVVGQRTQGAALAQWFVDNPRMTGDTEAFATEARAATAPGGQPLTVQEAEASAQYAARVRAQTTPPPPPR